MIVTPGAIRDLTFAAKGLVPLLASSANIRRAAGAIAGVHKGIALAPVVGLVTGGVLLGAAVGVLLAPQAGGASRARLARSWRKWTGDVDAVDGGAVGAAAE